ncbi:MAG: palindromic element RPE4 domain-containing protein [Gammaproteobacteria bacterium]|nr:palindromic element RPE4 domain-containing protein [Gammaproteobacteria bacterium]
MIGNFICKGKLSAGAVPLKTPSFRGLTAGSSQTRGYGLDSAVKPRNDDGFSEASLSVEGNNVLVQ